MRFAYVGFVTAPRPDWEQFAPTPQAPSNWKDSAKIAAYVREAREKQIDDAGIKPLTGVLREVVVLGPKNDTPLQINWPDNPILDFLSQYDRIACIDYGVFRSLAIADYADKRGSLDDNSKWAVISTRSGYPYLVETTRWASAPMLFDPLHALTGSHSEENTEPGLVLKRHGLALPYGPDALSRAVACRAICKRLGC